MSMSKTEGNNRLAKITQYGTTGALVTGAVVLISYLRSEGGRDRINTLMGGQLSGLEGQLQAAIQENMPMIDEAIDSLAEAIKQGVTTLTTEVTRYADEAKMRVRDYAAAPALSAGTDAHSGAEH